jgi:hypothetical protein
MAGYVAASEETQALIYSQGGRSPTMELDSTYLSALMEVDTGLSPKQPQIISFNPVNRYSPSQLQS